MMMSSVGNILLQMLAESCFIAAKSIVTGLTGLAKVCGSRASVSRSCRMRCSHAVSTCLMPW